MIKKDSLISRLQSALDEDCPNMDLSSELSIPFAQSSSAELIAKEAGVFYGRLLTDELCNLIDPKIQYSCHLDDGAVFKKGDTLLTCQGNTRSILRLERILLNFLQRLCGVASITNRFVTALNNPSIKVLDTRKTSPLFRDLERGAVLAGGGHNHRYGLSDMVLLKENHLKALGTDEDSQRLEDRILDFKKRFPEIKIEIELERLDQVQSYPLSHVDYILLDNMSIDEISEAIDICKRRGIPAELEVSGNIDLDSISRYSSLKIHRLSIGKLTHSVKAIDLSLLIT